MRRVALLGLVGVLVMALGAAGQPEAQACRPARDVHVCQAEGFGTILGQDTAQARDEALIDARRRALEQIAGVRVDAETITRNQVLFDQMVRTQTRGLIQAERVLDETVADGRVRVKIEAWVKSGEAQDRLEALLSELSIVVVFGEQNLGQRQEPSAVEGELVSRLVAGGYRVLDHAHVKRLAARDRLAALAAGDEQSAREIGLRFLANLLLVGEATTRRGQSNQGIVSAYARVNARVLEAETGRVVATIALEQVRGFGRDDVTAGERALGTAAGTAAERLLESLAAYFKVKERRIDVRLRGLPSIDQYRRAKMLLEKQRWVSGVEEGGYAAEESVIRVIYPEKTLYLASRIAREPGYRLVEFDRGRILLEYRQ